MFSSHHVDLESLFRHPPRFPLSARQCAIASIRYQRCTDAAHTISPSSACTEYKHIQISWYDISFPEHALSMRLLLLVLIRPREAQLAQMHHTTWRRDWSAGLAHTHTPAPVRPSEGTTSIHRSSIPVECAIMSHRGCRLGQREAV